MKVRVTTRLRRHWKAEEMILEVPGSQGQRAVGQRPAASPTSKKEKEEDEERRVIVKYQQNLNKAKSHKEPAANKSNTIQAALATIFSKLAEDMAGEPEYGDEYWDIDALLRRRYDRRPLHHAKMDRSREQMVLMLDTSGSCSNVSNYYATIAKTAAQFGDVVILNVPNGEITEQYDPVTDRWHVPKPGHRMDKETWEFNRRHILYFTDYDGVNQFVEGSQRNTVWVIQRTYNKDTGDDQYPRERGLAEDLRTPYNSPQMVTAFSLGPRYWNPRQGASVVGQIGIHNRIEGKLLRFRGQMVPGADKTDLLRFARSLRAHKLR